MKILVTGGAGFIGSALVRYLIEHTTHTVMNVDKLTYAGDLTTLKQVNGNHRYFFQQLDICDQKKISDLFSSFQPDAVMHLAAESHVDRSIYSSSAFIQTNIMGTYILLEATRTYWQTLSKNQQKQFRFHHISTDEVYGDLGDSNSFFHEDTPYAPSSPYSASKASSDHLVRAWHKTYGLPILITNCSNNYGAYQYPEKLIPLTILNALNGKALPIYGNGTQIRDWLYVDDHVKALYCVLQRGEIGSTYNIGGHCEKQNIEVVRTICAILEELIPIKNPEINSYSDLIKYVKDRPGHDYRYAIDATKIKNELAWQPTETFESGIRKTICWYIDNLEWCNAKLKLKEQLATSTFLHKEELI